VNKEKIEQYSFKVTQANKTQLVVIMYDIILDELAAAKEEYKANNIEAFVKTIKHAQKFLIELMNTLDCQYAVGLDLMKLYLYINKGMIQSIIQRKPDALEGLDEMILLLRNAFDQISRTDYSGPVMQTTEQVYAGLTYNRENLSEAYLDAGNQMRRGFTI